MNAKTKNVRGSTYKFRRDNVYGMNCYMTQKYLIFTRDESGCSPGVGFLCMHDKIKLSNEATSTCNTGPFISGLLLWRYSHEMSGFLKTFNTANVTIVNCSQICFQNIWCQRATDAAILYIQNLTPENTMPQHIRIWWISLFGITHSFCARSMPNTELRHPGNADSSPTYYYLTHFDT